MYNVIYLAIGIYIIGLLMYILFRKTDNIHLTEDTLFKVKDGLKELGWSDQAIEDAINSILNQGVVFREVIQDD